MRVVRVGIIGLGAVSRRLAQLLLARRAALERTSGVEVRIVAICSSSRGLHKEAGLAQAEIENPQLLESGACGASWLQNRVGTPDVLFDCGPSDFDKQPAPASLPYYRLMLGSGKAMIAVAKSALVSHGPELASLSDQHGAWIGLSGAVGSMLPSLGLLEGNLLGCRVNKIEACLNATSNYILDALLRNPATDTLAAAVELAQSEGFAERDVSRDTGGWDSMAKLILLANFGLRADMVCGELGLRSEDVVISGLSEKSVNPEAVALWRQTPLTPRLVSTLERVSVRDAGQNLGSQATTDQWSARVLLETYASDHPFSSLRGKTQAIVVQTDELGETFVAASSREPDATAAAALKDLQRWIQWTS